MLLSGHVLSFVNGAIGPAFLSCSVLKIIPPIAFIHGTIDMMIDSIAVRFIVDPITLIDITINMGELTLAVSAIVFPLTFIAGAIRPLLLAVTISETSNPFSTICSSSLECVCGALFSLRIRVVWPVLRNSLSAFLHSKVPRISPFAFHNESSVSPRQVTSE